MKKAQIKAKGRVKFKTPPINELVIALYHLPVINMQAQHIGLYWEKIRKHYPKCEQQVPVIYNVPVPGAQPKIIETQTFDLPRFWFHSGPGSMLIQVQRDGFFFNWRKDNENEYPQYEVVRAQFCKELDTYQSFLQNEFGQKIDIVNRCELTYINIIPPNDFWSTAPQLGKLFPPLASLTIPPEIGRLLVGVNSSFTYRFRDNLMVDSTVKLGKRLKTLEPVAMLEVKAHGTPEGLSIDKTLAWFDDAHDATHEVFLNFTDKNLQKTIWKPV